MAVLLGNEEGVTLGCDHELGEVAVADLPLIAANLFCGRGGDLLVRFDPQPPTSLVRTLNPPR